jgi:spore coat polysaccharide biosynthesis protein SpsF (cytidylyltransferase family)
MKNILTIIQARYGSTRFPGKVLKKVLGKPLMWFLIKRLELVKIPNKIIIATGPFELNKPIVEFAQNYNIPYFTGSENDVLDRYYQTAKRFGGDIIVRITSDCPLMDPELIDKGLEIFLKGKYDYISNNHPETYPDGYDVEICSFKALEKAWKEAKLPSEREHVMPYIWNHPERFNITVYKSHIDLSNYRITIDEPEDLLVISKIYEHFKENWLYIRIMDVINFLNKNPNILKINADFIRNKGYLKSLKEDKRFFAK